eukprot:1159930-Pelagomonas_calceolata.AAC.5
MARWWSRPSCFDWLRIYMLPLCRLQLFPRPSVLTILNFYEVNVPLVYTHLMGLSNAGGRSEFGMIGSNQYSFRNMSLGIFGKCEGREGFGVCAAPTYYHSLCPC